ncbi:hypothetical protein KI387_036232, partial [Taxus chinensis]
VDINSCIVHSVMPFLHGLVPELDEPLHKDEWFNHNDEVYCLLGLIIVRDIKRVPCQRLKRGGCEFWILRTFVDRREASIYDPLIVVQSFDCHTALEDDQR